MEEMTTTRRLNTSTTSRILYLILKSLSVISSFEGLVLAKEIAFVYGRRKLAGDLFLRSALTSLYTHLPIYVSRNLGFECASDGFHHLYKAWLSCSSRGTPLISRLALTIMDSRPREAKEPHDRI